MKKGKIIMAAVALLALMFIGGTIAYFTDTETVTNTFTLGNVDITLTEPTWTSTGATEAAANILPGAVIHKDPTVTNSGASPAYVFIKIKEPCYNTTKAFSYTVDSAWTVVGNAGSCSGTGVTAIETVYAYGTSSAMTELASSASTSALFSTVTLNTNLDQAGVTALSNDNTNGHQIVVTAYGIQSENLASSAPASVWANFTNGN